MSWLRKMLGIPSAADVVTGMSVMALDHGKRNPELLAALDASWREAAGKLGLTDPEQIAAAVETARTIYFQIVDLRIKGTHVGMWTADQFETFRKSFLDSTKSSGKLPEGVLPLVEMGLWTARETAVKVHETVLSNVSKG